MKRKSEERFRILIHRLGHLIVVVHFGVDSSQRSTKMRAKRPADRGADISRAEMINTILFIPHHDRKVLGDIIEENMKRMSRRKIRPRIKEPVHENRIGLFQRKLARVSDTQILQHHFHELATGEL